MMPEERAEKVWVDSAFEYGGGHLKALVAAAIREAVAEERERIKAVVVGQPYYPDTNVGMRQQWVKDEILRKIDQEA